MRPADFRYAAFTLILRLMQLTYASGLLGLLFAILWIPSLCIFHPLISRSEVSRELQIVIPGLLSFTLTCWYFWRADLIKLSRWKTEKGLIFATALMLIGNMGAVSSVLAYPKLPPGAASQLFLPLVFTLISYSLGALFGFRASRWWHVGRVLFTLIVLIYAVYLALAVWGPGIKYLCYVADYWPLL